MLAALGFRITLIFVGVPYCVATTPANSGKYPSGVFGEAASHSRAILGAGILLLAAVAALPLQ
jgi:hypothetical protein